MGGMPEVGALVSVGVMTPACPCGESRSRFGPQIAGMGTLEYACGHTWGTYGADEALDAEGVLRKRWMWTRLADFAVRDHYANAIRAVAVQFAEENRRE